MLIHEVTDLILAYTCNLLEFMKRFTESVKNYDIYGHLGKPILHVAKYESLDYLTKVSRMS